MTDLIPRDAAIAAITEMIDQANKRGLPSVAIIAMSCRQNIRAIPAIDQTAIREEALRDAASVIIDIRYRHEVMPSRYEIMPQRWREAILALIGEKK